MTSLALAAMAFGTALDGAACDTAASMREVTAAERAFAARSLEVGRRASFTEFAARGAFVFAPDPQRIEEIFPAQEPEGVSLDWWPAFTAVSADCAMAFSLGPWVFEDAGRDVRRYGYYATIWERGEQGWRFTIDGAGSGIDLPPRRVKGVEVVAAPTPDAGWKITRQDAVVAIGAADRALNTEGAADLAGALRSRLHPDAWMLGSRTEAAAGGVAAQEELARRPRSLRFTQSAVAASASGDFGYSYGLAQTGEGEDWNYMRIWRQEADGRWMVLFDGMKRRPRPGG